MRSRRAGTPRRSLLLGVGSAACLAACNLLIGLDGDTQLASPSNTSDGAVDRADADAPAADALAPTPAVRGEVRLLAGEPGGSGYRDGPPTVARFGAITGVVADQTGNLFVVDTVNRVLRKIASTTLEVSTLAGAFQEGGSADGVFSTARFDQPDSIAFDGRGMLYVSERSRCTIREIDLATAGVRTVLGQAGCGFADGPATTARLNQPHGLAWLNGALYIADTGNQRIRVFDRQSAELSTACGSSGTEQDGTCNVDARLLLPRDLAADPNGAKLYIQGGRTQVIDLSANTLVTLAGAEEGARDGGLGPARLGGRGIVYSSPHLNVADDTFVWQIALPPAPRLQQLWGSSERAWVDGSFDTARFEGIRAMTLLGAPNSTLVIADAYTIRVTGGQTLETLAGRGTAAGYADGPALGARFASVQGLTSDGSSVFVYDAANTAIRAVDLTTSIVRTVAGRRGENASIDAERGADVRINDESDGIVYDGRGHLILSDGANSQIRRVNVATGATTTLTRARALGRGLASNKDGLVYFSSSEAIGVWSETDPDSAQNLAGLPGQRGAIDAVGTAARFLTVASVCLDPSQNAIIALDTEAGTLRKVDLATKAVTTIAGVVGQLGHVDGVGEAARFKNPTHVACDGLGHAFVTEATTLRRVDLSSGAVTTVAGVLGRSAIAPGPLPAGLNRPIFPVALASDRVILASQAEAALVEVRLPRQGDD